MRSGIGHGTTIPDYLIADGENGKFILELARAKEGEKTSWISVPRKTFWPPTVSSTSANFHKHESSTSLSFSDDNSSIQSSPWQRDHCWKQANPRANISKELALYYFRPPNVRFRLARDTRARLRRKRRRPYEATLPAEVKQTDSGPVLPFDIESRRTVEPPVVQESARTEDSTEGAPSAGCTNKPTEDGASNGETPMDTSEPAPAAPMTEGRKETHVKSRSNGHLPLSNGHHHQPEHAKGSGRGRCKRVEGKDLATIVQALSEQQQQRVAATVANHAPPSFRLGAIAGGNGNVRNVVFGSGAASQHVSPRKRILRELEKVSLEEGGSGTTMKRSRPKSGGGGSVGGAGTPVIVTATTATPLSALPTNGAINGSSNGSSGGGGSRTNGHLNGTGSGSNGSKHLSNGVGSRSPVTAASSASAPPPTATTPVTRPFSSYSITSLLGHTTPSSESSSSSEAAAQRKPEQNPSSGSVASVTSTASHYQHQLHGHHHPLSPHQQYQHQQLTSSPKSPTMMDLHHQHHPLLPHHSHGYPQPGSYHGPNRYHGAGSKKRSPNYGNGATGGSPGAIDQQQQQQGGPPYGGAIRSPDLSPSPEHTLMPQHHPHSGHHHHSTTPGGSGGFTRYRQHPYGGSPSSYSSAPSRFSPSPSTNDSTTPPYVRSSSSSYRAAYLAGNSSGSPPATNGSPQHYSRASPLNFGRGALLSSPPPSSGSAHHSQHHQQQGQGRAGGNLSPRASPSSTSSSSGSHGNGSATTPTSAMAALTTSSSPAGNVRTVPKKTAALRQPFSAASMSGSGAGGQSPSRERSHSNASSSSSSLSVKKELQLLPDAPTDTVDGPVSLASSSSLHYASGVHPGSSTGASGGVIRPSTVIASPSPHHHHHHHHPAAVAAASANPFYSLYPPQLAASLLTGGSPSASSSGSSTSTSSPANAAALAAAFHPAAAAAYYQMYSATMAAAAYRHPLWMHYPGIAAVAPQGPHHMIAPPPPASLATIGSTDGRRMDHRNALSPPLPQGIAPAASSSPPIHVTDSRPPEHQRLHSSQPLPATSTAAALNYSVTALTSSSSSSPSARGAVPSGSWATSGGGGEGYPHHDHSIAAPAAKEDPSNGECLRGQRSYVPLNLSKH
ncbi:AGAP004344-PA-like protein [Anopheles sinensis]|uniref:AGAP004344-PA-like protein n=1 Tax=Anopheles sinensis TaxID=74873 RepID=A0A084WQ88_ANOSI|nr:AGAP004344-PA-like protein [Anopheles sinensis]